MKYLIPIILLFILLASSSLFSQQKTNWVYVGSTQKYEVYYLKNSVVRGTFTYVTVAGECRKKETDPDGREYKYATAMLAFYKSTYGDIRCIMAQRCYFYNDNEFRKGVEPKVEYVVASVKILNDIYNKIK